MTTVAFDASVSTPIQQSDGTWIFPAYNQTEFLGLLKSNGGNMQAATDSFLATHAADLPQSTSNTPASSGTSPSWLDVFTNPGKAGANAGSGKSSTPATNPDNVSIMGSDTGIHKRYLTAAFTGAALVAVLLFIAALSELSLESAWADIHGH